jgi:hypothetical protein
MDSSEDLERRVTAVEAEVAITRREAAAARALAAGADRDVADYRAEMRAHTRGLGALRETQIEHYAEHKANLADFKAEVTSGLGHIVHLIEGLGGNSGSPGPDREPS